MVLCRSLDCCQEIKALMQQGVYETPIYNGYMLKGTLEEYEKKVRVRQPEKHVYWSRPCAYHKQCRAELNDSNWHTDTDTGYNPGREQPSRGPTCLLLVSHSLDVCCAAYQPAAHQD